jgi:poly(A) polymerase Pap1
MIMKDNDHKKGPIIMKLLPFGSYALRGHTRHADIDLALICPAIVKRVYFKRILLDLLRQQATIQDVTV